MTSVDLFVMGITLVTLGLWLLAAIFYIIGVISAFGVHVLAGVVALIPFLGLAQGICLVGHFNLAETVFRAAGLL